MACSRIVFASLLLLFLSACTRHPAEENLLNSVFAAFADEDWTALRKVMVTAVDLDVKAKARPEAAIKPIARRTAALDYQERTFNAVLDAQGDGSMIDFQESEFAGLGKKIGERELIQSSGKILPVSIYSLKIRDKKSGQEKDQVLPYFAVVMWNGSPRLLSIVTIDYWNPATEAEAIEAILEHEDAAEEDEEADENEPTAD